MEIIRTAPAALTLAPLILSVLFFGCMGKRPILGLTQGRLAPCPSSPNCVSSMAAETDKSHYIEPLAYPPSQQEHALMTLLRLLADYERATLVEDDDTYLHVEFKSKLLRFVDDVEFYFPEDEPIIHIRSASRVGYSDFGVNRKRIERIRTQFIEAMK